MLPAGALQTMKVFFATPCLGGQTTAVHSVSVFGLAGDCVKLGMQTRLEYHSESLITRSRNLLMSKFLAAPEEYTHLFFLDADVMFQSSAVYRLLLADKDVAVGIYPLKNHNNWPPDPGLTMKEFEERQSQYSFMPKELVSDDDGFVPVYPATTGFMCIKRHVFLKMMAAYPERLYKPDFDGGPLPDDLHYDLFPAMIEPTSRKYWSEDYGFCYLWHAIGGKVWGDSQSKLSHAGPHVWRGDLAAKLDRDQAFAVAKATVQEAA